MSHAAGTLNGEAAPESPGRQTEPYLPPATHPVRAVVWAIHLIVPMLGLWLLLANPDTLDIKWQHEPSHFWLIIAVAGINVVLGGMISQAAARRQDARLVLVSLVFLSSAGFFLMHGLTTPKIILPAGSYGFDLSQPVGLTVASAFAFASALPLGDRAARWVLARTGVLRGALALFLVLWGFASLVPDLTPLSDRPPADGATLGLFSLVAVFLYTAAAIMVFRMHRKRPSSMLISLITAYALLAEAMFAAISHRNWALSWWEWHILLTFAFGFVAYSAYIQFRREGSSAGLFDSIALAATVRRLQAQYDEALEELVGHLRRRAESPVPVATRLAGKFRLTESQAAVLDRAGEALANERELSERLAALVDVGRTARVGLDEKELLATALDRVRQAYGDVRIGLVADGVVSVAARDYSEHDFPGGEPVRHDDALVHPLTVKGKLAGAMRVPIGRTPQDAALAGLLAGQMSISLENARLYGELSTLFRQYMSPDVAAALLADPEQAALGGSLVELTALFADLKGFTTFSEKVAPGEIVDMLNRYHTAAVPCILDNGGTIVQFVGDALLALFNAPARQQDHALAAARAGLAMQRAAARVAEEVAAEQAAGRLNGVEWPQFRVGVNTGMALVGNIGSPELRGFNAMGDSVNVAARLQALAEPGTVVIGSTTYEQLGTGARVSSLGDLSLKGKEQPVHAYVLHALPE
ncbi:class 3 adenylate cyclase [Thermocatellispora tengchongensis]|uniref:Class 3 adenylate cyclase n=1 Tax=Thermocatellispora tengchongensis TaxID=1073253 RepID=A0A840PHN4_9ACTN|nr:adenylate/guanylate cyclase domain-containing protein [Thermocatellispora tengchongensis]MBB5138652.1 class 3 adenylate cyclase [Thermocatellispora tengchongensis]